VGPPPLRKTRSEISRSRLRQSHAKLTVMQIFHRIPAILGFTISVAFCHAARTDEKPMMKAVVAHEYGAPEVLKFEEVPRPEPKEDEALVRGDRERRESSRPAHA